MGKREDVSGWNGRFSKLRNRGQTGSQGANSFPFETNSLIAAADPAGIYDGTDILPVAATSFEVIINVTEAFNNNATLIVGSTIDTDLLVTLADAVDLAVLGEQRVTGEINWPEASVVRATIAGTPDVGAADIRVSYTV